MKNRSSNDRTALHSPQTEQIPDWFSALDPLVLANELISAANDAIDHGDAARSTRYFDAAEAMLDACETSDQAAAWNAFLSCDSDHEGR